jgi:hypothetical protein
MKIYNSIKFKGIRTLHKSLCHSNLGNFYFVKKPINRFPAQFFCASFL